MIISFTGSGLPFFALKSVHADSLVTLTKDSDNSSGHRLCADKKKWVHITVHVIEYKSCCLLKLDTVTVSVCIIT